MLNNSFFFCCGISSSTSTSSMSLSLSMNSLNSLGSSQSLCNEEKFFQESDMIREFEIKKLTTDKQKVQLDPRLQNKIRFVNFIIYFGL